jgi:hypothetical protein
MSDRDEFSEGVAELERALIRSARLDAPVPASARNRILAAVGVVGSVVGASGAAAGGAAASGSAWFTHSPGVVVVAKWLAA